MPGPKPFDVVVPLTSPFFYKPSAGNLLLDIRSVGGNTVISLDAQDTTGDSIGRQYSSIVNGNLNSLTSNTLRPSLGLVTRFTTIVPEPIAAQLAVVGISLATCLARRQKNAGNVCHNGAQVSRRAVAKNCGGLRSLVACSNA